MAQHKAVRPILRTPRGQAVSRVMARRINRRQRAIAIMLLAGLFAGAGTLVAFQPDVPANAASFNIDTAVTAQTLTANTGTVTVSRSTDRQPIANTTGSTAQGEWTMGVDTEITGDVAKKAADNEQVALLITGRDKGATPAGFDPNHATNDNGNGYAFSQCTWWVYLRRHELGLPVGTHYGNGHQWADTARSLGYWVDTTPRQGDIMVFERGQDSSSWLYGHVAIVEQVNSDGSIETSECGASYGGKPFTRHFTAEQAAQHQFIHY